MFGAIRNICEITSNEAQTCGMIVNAYKNGTQVLLGRRFYKVIDLDWLSLSFYLLGTPYSSTFSVLVKNFLDF